jgi:hypothetical protein
VGTLVNVAVLSREEFDAIEFEATLTGDHQSAAARMAELAATGIQSESMPRAEAFVRVGEQWLLADNPAAAADGFRMAIADGGPVEVDPRAPLCRALVQLGKEDEAKALINTMLSEGRSDPRACEVIGELLLEQSDLNGALEWVTVGVELILQGAAQAESTPYPGLNELLRLRYRIRNDLRLPEDEFDRMLSA